jgi:hypothetical protein
VLAFAAPAQAKFLGTFLGNNADLKWKVIETEHFNVFYPVSRWEDSKHPVDGLPAARKTAVVAEEMYPKICGQFNHFLKEKVNIVLVEQADSLTGYTIPNFDWIVISAHHSDMLWRWRGHHDWLRVVLYHEFAHVVSLKADSTFASEAVGGWNLSLRWSDTFFHTDAGFTLNFGDGDPWFWVEGGAEHYTDEAGINKWTSNRDMFMRMDILEGTLLNFGDMQDYYGSNGGFDGERHYNEGYAFAQYLEERFGEGIYQSFAKRREEKGWSPNWMSVIKDVLNIDPEQLYVDWKAWSTEKYKKVEARVMENPAIGLEMESSRPAWMSLDEEKRTEWEDKEWWRRKRDRERSGRHNLFQRYSDDGRWFATQDLFRSISMLPVPEDAWPSISGCYSSDLSHFEDETKEELEGVYSDWLVADTKAVFGRSFRLKGSYVHDGQFDISPDGEKLAVIYSEDEMLSKFERDLGINGDGYSWSQLYVFDRGRYEADAEAHFEGRKKKEYRAYRKQVEERLKAWAEKQEKEAEDDEAADDEAEDAAVDEEGEDDGEESEEDEPLLVGEHLEACKQYARYLSDVYAETNAAAREILESTGGMPKGAPADGEAWPPLPPPPNRHTHFQEHKFDLKDYLMPVEGVRRVSDPSFSPDGEWLAFVLYDAGNQNLYKSRLDGSEKTQLTFWNDQTRIEVTDWSPDGTQVVFGAYRCLPQLRDAGAKDCGANDLWVVNADGSDLHQITHDPYEDRDPHWGHDGNIYFASDRVGGIYNIFRYNPDGTLGALGSQGEDEDGAEAADSAEAGGDPEPVSLDEVVLSQLTNVVGGAFTPWLTPKGNLTYGYYTAFGWKNYMLAREDFIDEPVDDSLLRITDEQQQGALAAQEEFPDFSSQTKGGAATFRVRVPFLIPLLEIGNSSRSHMGVNAGIFMWIDDYLDNHTLMALAQFGERTVLFGRYEFKALWPNIYLGGFHQRIKFDYGFALDDDEDSTTTDDVEIGDIKMGYAFSGVFGGVELPISRAVQIGFGTFAYQVATQGVSDGARYEPLIDRLRNEITLNLQNLNFDRNPVNPRGGRHFGLNVGFNFTRMREGFGGNGDVDDGELLDDYFYTEVQAAFTEYIALPSPKGNKEFDHTLQLSALAGFIDRNVQTGDEFAAGGQSALNFRNPYGTDVAFAGYPGYSLRGESMLILNAAYRFPVKRNIDKKLGILYVESIYAQLFGTAGNLWSYHIEEGARTKEIQGGEIALDPSKVRREWPGQRAEKNGQFAVFDVGAELRFRMNLFNRSPWNTFVRLAYGFNKIGGVGDVDGDDIYTNAEDPNLGNLSSERVRGGVRAYVGLGYGW